MKSYSGSPMEENCIVCWSKMIFVDGKLSISPMRKNCYSSKENLKAQPWKIVVVRQRRISKFDDGRNFKDNDEEHFVGHWTEFFSSMMKKLCGSPKFIVWFDDKEIS